MEKTETKVSRAIKASSNNIPSNIYYNYLETSEAVCFITPQWSLVSLGQYGHEGVLAKVVVIALVLVQVLVLVIITIVIVLIVM